MFSSCGENCVFVSYSTFVDIFCVLEDKRSCEQERWEHISGATTSHERCLRYIIELSEERAEGPMGDGQREKSS